MEKIDRSSVRSVRYAVQWGILLFLIFAGYRFSLFVEYFLSLPPFPETLIPAEGVPGDRAPSIEGFLPIGALMGLKLWITTGIFDRIHPAGLVIFIAAIVMALLLRKGFCSWICPVGTLSEASWKLGRRIFGRNLRIPVFADYPLRSLKYLLLAFFLSVVVLQMPPMAILSFLEGDYYRIADVKMLFFFTEMTRTTFVTLFVLFVLSVATRNFWCRYLCPYGALLGLLSLLSPSRITRNENACIRCGRCSRDCPAHLPVDRKIAIRSPECSGCLTCVSGCPSKDALDVAVGGKRISPFVFAALVIVLFFGAVGAGKVTGKWESAVTTEEYRRLIPQASVLDHP